MCSSDLACKNKFQEPRPSGSGQSPPLPDRRGSKSPICFCTSSDRQFENINLLAGDTWDDKVAPLRECVDALPDRQKDVISGRYFDENLYANGFTTVKIGRASCRERV